MMTATEIQIMINQVEQKVDLASEYFTNCNLQSPKLAVDIAKSYIDKPFDIVE